MGVLSRPLRTMRPQGNGSTPIALAVVVALTGGVGCTSMGTKVTRVDSREVIDVSGYWNDADVQLVAREMVEDLVSRAWLKRWRAQHDVPPRVVVGRVRNKTEEHISTEPIVRSLERELTNAGDLRFVASRDERDELRAERAEQHKHASEETVKRFDQESASDFILGGAVHSIVDQEGGLAVHWYQVSLQLIDMETGEKVWIGESRIKKVVERDEYAW